VTTLARRVPESAAVLGLVTVASVAVGFLSVRQPLVLLACIGAGIGLVVAFRYLTAAQFALVAFVLYLPLDWLLVLLLDSFGLSEGRLLRPLLTVGLAAACFFARGDRAAPVPSAIAWALGVVVGISLLELFNPGLPDLSTAGVGILTRLIPLVLLPAGLYLALTRKSLTSLTRALAWVMVASGVVIMFQLARGDTLVSLVGLKYPLFGVSHEGVSVQRYPGPFLGAGLGMVMMFAFAAFVGFGHLLHRRERVLLVAAWACWLLALFANTQRSLFLFLVIDAPLVILLGRFRNFLRRAPVALVLLVPAAALAGNAFITRAQSITKDPGNVIVQQHIVTPYESRVATVLQQAPIGHGLGTASPGIRFVLGEPDLQTTPESFIAGTIHETGIPGLVAYLLLFALIAGVLLQRALSADDVTTRRFCAATLAITLWVIQLAVAYEPLSYYPFAPLYWLFVGVALGLPRGRPSRT
jgi:hypothetical protein